MFRGFDYEKLLKERKIETISINEINWPLKKYCLSATLPYGSPATRLLEIGTICDVNRIFFVKDKDRNLLEISYPGNIIKDCDEERELKKSDTLGYCIQFSVIDLETKTKAYITSWDEGGY